MFSWWDFDQVIASLPKGWFYVHGNIWDAEGDSAEPIHDVITDEGETAFFFHIADLIRLQYTEKDDLNGNMIFDGWILEAPYFDDADRLQKELITVFWADGGFWLDDSSRQDRSSRSAISEWDMTAMKVVGNIYENPEIIQAKKDVV